MKTPRRKGTPAPAKITVCKQCGAPYVLIQSLDRIWRMPPGRMVKILDLTDVLRLADCGDLPVAESRMDVNGILATLHAHVTRGSASYCDESVKALRVKEFEYLDRTRTYHSPVLYRIHIKDNFAKRRFN